jgi:Leucine-rich repeat (LRR) protein
MSTKMAKRITLDTLLGAATLTKSSKETTEAYLGRVTHLHLQGKKIDKIEGLELCSNLKVLYLYDNHHHGSLYYLYLQNNNIKDIPKLQMPALRKLYLDDNSISVVSGLSMCCILEELHLARQQLPTFTSLRFDPETLQSISTLQVLEVSSCGISQLNTFTVLRNLRKIFARDNQVGEGMGLVGEMDETARSAAQFVFSDCGAIAERLRSDYC